MDIFDSDQEEVIEPEQALVRREESPGAIIPGSPAQSLIQHPGIGQARFTKEQQEILERVPDDSDVDILPTGEIYYGQVQYRRRLNEAFGPGGWGLIPVGQFFQDGETLMREFALVVEGRVVATGMGETDFQPNNPRFTKATAAEVVKSIALRRAAKDLGIADDCWDRRFIQRWLKDNAVRVWVTYVGRPGRNKPGDKQPQWRRKDAPQLEYPWCEDGVGKMRNAAKAQKDPADVASDPVLDPNAKWKGWSAAAAKTNKGRLMEILGLHGFEKASDVTDRKTQIEIFKEWEGEENA